MDGLLIIDKPAGPTSHDVVARMRRALREPRIGHTGTLDPAATGVLPLVLGRATRLAQFMQASTKTYDARIRLGVRTDTADTEGQVVGERYDGPLPTRAAIESALDAFRGTFLQQPPAFSAKKVGGVRSYKAARTGGPVAALPAPVRVTVHQLDLVDVAGDLVDVRIDCSAGFYVRSLAHDLGERLGTGAHLDALRRTRSGEATVLEALPLDAAERSPADAIAAIVPLNRLLRDVVAVTLTGDGVRRAVHGRDLGPGDAQPPSAMPAVNTDGPVRLLDPDGDLVGIAMRGTAPGLLHPSVILR